MKKTLVALAVLAASGASFAQVTITGQYGYGFKSTTTGSDTKSGLGISDSNIVFDVTEDLGGGLKAAAKMKIDGINRAGIGGGDSFVTLSGGFGTVSMGLAEYDTDLPDSFGTFMGATIATLGGVDSERIADFVQYGTSFGPVGVSVRHTEAANDKLAVPNPGTMGVGSAGNTKQRLNTVAATYAAGPLSAKVDYSMYDNKDSVVPSYDTRTTIGGNYDLGAVKFGLGYQKATWTAGVSVTDTFIGATIPLGALAIGVDYLSSKLDGSGANDKTYTGTGVQATYSLSKRTNVRFRYSTADESLANVDKTSRVALAFYHNF